MISLPQLRADRKGIEYTERLIQKWENDPLVSIAVEAHRVYVQPGSAETCHAIARKHGVLVIHVAETLTELAEIQAKIREKTL